MNFCVEIIFYCYLKRATPYESWRRKATGLKQKQGIFAANFAMTAVPPGDTVLKNPLQVID